MKQTAVINIRTEPHTKKAAHKVAEDLGFSLSSLLNGYLHDLIRSKEVHYDAEEPSPYLKRIIKQAEKDWQKGNYTLFHNPKDAVAYLDKIIER